MKRLYKTVLDFHVTAVEHVEVVLEAESEAEAIELIMKGEFKRFLPISKTDVEAILDTNKEAVFEVD